MIVPYLESKLSSEGIHLQTILQKTDGANSQQLELQRMV
jgi:hypothetical protein